MKIEDLFTKTAKYETHRRKSPEYSPLSKRKIEKKPKSEPKKFEDKVFTYLHEHRRGLGIDEAYALTNMLVDSALMLNNGQLVLLEIKYALNWHNACNARVEILRFITEKLYENLPTSEVPDRALVIFDHFSRDWDRKPKNRKLKNGWNNFYEEEAILRASSVMPIDIAQLTEGILFNPLLGWDSEQGLYVLHRRD